MLVNENDWALYGFILFYTFVKFKPFLTLQTQYKVVQDLWHTYSWSLCVTCLVNNWQSPKLENWTEKKIFSASFYSAALFLVNFSFVEEIITKIHQPPLSLLIYIGKRHQCPISCRKMTGHHTETWWKITVITDFLPTHPHLGLSSLSY